MRVRVAALASVSLLFAGLGCSMVACGASDDPSGGDGGAGSRVDAGRVPHLDGAAALASDSAATAGDDATSADASEASSDAGARAGGPLVAYVGGYGGVITRYAVDEGSGDLGAPSPTAAFGASPSFLAVTAAATFLYATDESAPGKVGAYAITPGTGALTFLASAPSGGDGPAYVGLDRSDAFVLVANYTSGTTEVLPIGGDGSLGAPTDTRTPGMLAHMIIADPTNRFVFVPCKGSDYVAQFTFDARTGKLTPNAKAATMSTAKGAGPRHLAFHPNGKLAYLIDETASSLQSLALDTTDGTLTSLQTTSSLGAANDGADAGGNTAAELWVHPSGKWLLASNRGDDSLVVFALDEATGAMTFTGRTRSGGRPRATSPSRRRERSSTPPTRTAETSFASPSTRSAARCRATAT